MCSSCAASPLAVKTHAGECGAISLLAPVLDAGSAGFKTEALRLFVRLLVVRARATAETSSDDGEGDTFDDVRRLVQPPEQASWDLAATGGAGGQTPLRSSFLRMTRQVRGMMGAEARLGLDEGAGLLARLSCNTLTLYADGPPGDAVVDEPRDAAGRVGTLAAAQPAVIGCTLSPRAAMLNHSCEPNSDWQLDATGHIVVIVTRDVDADEELTIPYVDPRIPADDRQDALRRKFHFLCDCRACAAGVASWTCALCGQRNGAFDRVCAGFELSAGANKRRRCGAAQAAMAAPVGQRRKCAQ